MKLKDNEFYSLAKRATNFWIMTEGNCLVKEEPSTSYLNACFSIESEDFFLELTYKRDTNNFLLQLRYEDEELTLIIPNINFLINVLPDILQDIQIKEAKEELNFDDYTEINNLKLSI